MDYSLVVVRTPLAVALACLVQRGCSYYNVAYTSWLYRRLAKLVALVALAVTILAPMTGILLLASLALLSVPVRVKARLTSLQPRQ